MIVPTKHVIVSGDVHGVGFRNYVRKHAQLLNVSGWVRNLIDGRVEALLQGAPDALENLIKRMGHGPEMAKVSGIHVQEVAPLSDLSHFIIEQDGVKPWSNV